MVMTVPAVPRQQIHVETFQLNPLVCQPLPQDRQLIEDRTPRRFGLRVKLHKQHPFLDPHLDPQRS
jgi:hypothetical protein